MLGRKQEVRGRKPGNHKSDYNHVRGKQDDDGTDGD
jgi:hypothetical protein